MTEIATPHPTADLHLHKKTLANFQTQLDGMRVWKSGEKAALHKPLLVLLALNYVQLGRPRLLSFSTVREPLNELLAEFVTGDVVARPEYAFWRLANDGFWEVRDRQLIIEAMKAGGAQYVGDVSARVLLACNAEGGFTQDLFAALSKHPQEIERISDLLIASHFPRFSCEDVINALHRQAAGTSVARSDGDTLPMKSRLPGNESDYPLLIDSSNQPFMRVGTMALRNNKYQEDYRSVQDDILNDLYRASLREATEYWRAVGYFSSSALEVLGVPLSEFISRGGTIRLVTSVELSAEDLQAIHEGLSRQEVCEGRIEEIIEEQFTGAISSGVMALVSLLEMGRMAIRIAVPRVGTGIYHEKVGLFLDGTDYVAFAGSANESQNALRQNYECIDVYPSWKDPERAERKKEHFENLWSNQVPGAEVFSFPEAAARKLIQITKRPSDTRSGRETLAKWRHQDDAVKRFLDAERGVLNMATGTGKTRTALKILEKLIESDQIDRVLISTDGTDLLNQWYRELLGIRNVGGRKLRVFRHYADEKQIAEFSLDSKDAVLLCSREPLAIALRRLGSEGYRTLLIHDEVHGLGSPGNRKSLAGLSDNVRFRLGLSATPEREYDQEGNEFIERHIGPELFSFGLKDAIERGILSPFNYFPLFYTPSDEDQAKIKKVYAQQAARKHEGKPMTKEEVWIALAHVHKVSREKLPVFEDFIAGHVDLLERCIIFVETQEYGNEVVELVHKHHPDFHTYFASEDSQVLQRFARGDLKCLVTCHRLSEGIDIRSLNTVILFSSARARLETIQRMGRCLRTDPTNPDKVANIVDFIRTEDDGALGPNSDMERCAWLTELATIRPME